MISSGIGAPLFEAGSKLICRSESRHSYRIKRHISTGGYAHVYEAFDSAGERLALKVLKGSLREPVEATARMHREREFTCVDRHPNIIRSFGIFESFSIVETNGRALNYDACVLSLEYFGGESCQARFRGKPLKCRLALAIFGEVVDAVAHMHELGWIHRDITPNNVLVGGIDDQQPSKTQVRLIDFGLAKSVKSNLNQVTDAAGGRRGTLAFCAPEQLDDFGVAHKPSDVYGLASLLFFLLTGQAPFQKRTGVRTYPALGEREGSLRLIPPEVHTRLDYLLKQCTRDDPDDRWSVDTLGSYIDEIIEDLDTRSRWENALAAMQKAALVGLGDVYVLSQDHYLFVASEPIEIDLGSIAENGSKELTSTVIQYSPERPKNNCPVAMRSGFILRRVGEVKKWAKTGRWLHPRGESSVFEIWNKERVTRYSARLKIVRRIDIETSSRPVSVLSGVELKVLEFERCIRRITIVAGFGSSAGNLAR